MGVRRNQVAAGAALLAAACQSNADLLDLRENATLYRDTGYAVEAPVDCAAFVAPMVESRTSIVEATGPYPTRWVPDTVWVRSPLKMVQEIVVDELDASGVFAELAEEPRPTDLIVTPHLVQLQLGEEEQVSGRRGMALVALRVVVHGPGASAEQREVVFDRTFDEVAATPVQRDPTPATQLVGIALRRAIVKLLGALDQSNISRSQVPDEPSITGR